MKKEFLEPLVSYFKKRSDIRCVYLFGSEVTGKGWKSRPDLDIGIIFEKEGNLSRIYADISGILKRDDLDIVNLNKIPLLLAHEIIKKGKCIFSDKIDREEYEIKTHLLYYDTKFLRDLLNGAMVERLKEGRFGYG